MILKASQRGGARQLALHLLKSDENEHVEVHDIRGFVSSDLESALHEAYAVSRGTRCRQFLFSLSLSPPERERVPIQAFEDAIAEVEGKLGLSDQPRAVVFHEKAGRRHAHCVWSRIDTDAMKAINLPHFKLKLRDVSRQLYIDHGWRMPHGLVNSRERDPRNFTRQEWQQAKRAGQDPKTLKGTFQECWAISDSGAAFANALAARGFYLARGDRRGFVAVDYRGEVYSIARWTGLRTKEVTGRLGQPEQLPSVAETKAGIGTMLTDMLKRHLREAEQGFRQRSRALSMKRERLTRSHQHQRQALKERQQERWRTEATTRAQRVRHGLKGAWDRITGRYSRVRRMNEAETIEALRRDRSERDALIADQLEERQRLQRQIRQQRHVHTIEMASLQRDIAAYLTKKSDMANEAPQHTRNNRWRTERTGIRP